MGVLQKGARVGDYAVVRKLGEGQFAEVWEIKDGAGARVSPSLWLRRSPALAAVALPHVQRRAGRGRRTCPARAAARGACLRALARACGAIGVAPRTCARPQQPWRC